MAKYKIGSLYHITFLDHAMHSQGSSGALECSVYGKLVKETTKTIDIRTWDMSDPTDELNVEGFTIIKGAIVSSKEIK